MQLFLSPFGSNILSFYYKFNCSFFPLPKLYVANEILLVSGSAFGKGLFANNQGISRDRVRALVVRCSNSDHKAEASRASEWRDEFNVIKRRDLMGLVFGFSSLFIDSFDAKGAGLPPEQKPRLCDDTCEKELENVW